MSFEEWYERETNMAESIYKNTADYGKSKEAWNAAIDEAVKVANERTSDYHSQIQHISENRAAIRIIEAIKELK